MVSASNNKMAIKDNSYHLFLIPASSTEQARKYELEIHVISHPEGFEELLHISFRGNGGYRHYGRGSASVATNEVLEPTVFEERHLRQVRIPRKYHALLGGYARQAFEDGSDL